VVKCVGKEIEENGSQIRNRKVAEMPEDMGGKEEKERKVQ
jgi:hypothetical protein